MLLPAERDQAAAARDRAIAAVKRVTDKAGSARNDPNPDRAHTAESAVAGGRLVLANLAQASGDYDEALAQLDQFEQDFPEQTALKLQAMTRKSPGSRARRSHDRVLPDES